MRQIIATVPPYAPFIPEVVKHPRVKGLRLNTVMPVQEPKKELLKKLQALVQEENKELWIDLKGRQLRVLGYWVPPFTGIQLSHGLYVQTPTTALLSDGREQVTVVAVDGNRLITLEGPPRVVGPGESINIPDPSLRIEGYLTDQDKIYLEAAAEVDVHRFMLSFFEAEQDLFEARRIVGEAEWIAKIESVRGITYVETEYRGPFRLMAARGDLFWELAKPHHILPALETILRADPDAVLASRLFGSLAFSLTPSCADLGDVDNLLRMGYKTFMLGDEICLRRDSLISALNIFALLAERYES
ncbi:MAG: hypothetical protein EHM45_09160 [Desulfobacteraceae bacterium]|nr:MAG: hypothetical protein EHM45_09160 [Desulfobacteraceae bacterium]